MFTTLIVKPIFNLLVLIYAVLPGHNFGLAIIIFTVLVRLLMWPLVKKQLHHAKAMRELQPELKRIKKAAAGDKQKESQMVMELYKERQINPFSSLGIMFVQLPILIGLYSGLRRIVVDPHAVITFSYPWLHHLGWMKTLAGDITRFDSSLFGTVDLTRAAIGKDGKVYWAAMLIVVGSAIIQYYQSKQLMPADKDGRTLRKILKDAGSGKEADQGEVNAAVGRSTRFFIPAMILFLTVNIASALSLYWLVGGITAYIQQDRVLRDDTVEMEEIADQAEQKEAKKTILEGEIIEKPKANKKKKGNGKRRKK
jgi:YidC/Oxa1 family membrane protein insertase